MRRAPWVIGLLLTAALLALILVIPFIGVVIQSFTSDTPFDAYGTIFSSSTTMEIIGRTLLFALVTSAVSVVIGFPVAYGLARAGNKLRVALLVLLIVPYLASVIVRTFAWIGVLGAAGPVRALGQLFGIEKLSLVGTGTSVMLTLIHVYLPYVILLVWASMRTIDPNHVKAAETMGARPLEVFWSVYAPQSLPGVISSAVLTFVITAGMVATPSLIGGTDQTTVAMIITKQTLAGYDLRQDVPAGLAVLLTLAVFAILAIGLRFAGAQALLGVATNQKGRLHGSLRARRFGRFMGRLGRRKQGKHWVVAIMTVIAVLIIDGPIVYLAGMSLQPLPLLTFPTTSVSTKWFTEVLSDPSWGVAVLNSVLVGVIGTVIAVVAAALLAAATTRARAPWNGIIIVVALLPLLLPVVSFIPGLYRTFAALGFIGNPIAIALAHAVLILPLAYIPILSGLQSHDSRLEDAAATLGASRAMTLRRVTLPLLAPVLVIAFALAFLSSFDEYTATSTLAGIRFETLPMKFYAASKQNLSPELAALGVILIIVILIIAAAIGLIVRRLNNRVRRSTQSGSA